MSEGRSVQALRGYVKAGRTVALQVRRGAAVKPEEVRREIGRLQDERLRLAPEVLGGGREARREDERLQRLIAELTGADRDTRADELRAAWRRRHGGGEG